MDNSICFIHFDHSNSYFKSVLPPTAVGVLSHHEPSFWMLKQIKQITVVLLVPV